LKGGWQKIMAKNIKYTKVRVNCGYLKKKEPKKNTKNKNKPPPQKIK
jgi:cytochrome oxidase assembly protein ShyY1